MAKHSGYKTASATMRHRNPQRYGGAKATTHLFNRDGQTLAVFVDYFIDDLKMLNRTECALKSWRHKLTPFLVWTDERDLIYPAQITRSILESYQRHQHRHRKKNGQPLGITTQRDRIGAVRSLFSWLCKKRFLDANPASELDLPKPEKRLPDEALSRSDIESILSVPDISDPLGIRDRAMLELFYSRKRGRTKNLRKDRSSTNFS